MDSVGVMCTNVFVVVPLIPSPYFFSSPFGSYSSSWNSWRSLPGDLLVAIWLCPLLYVDCRTSAGIPGCISPLFYTLRYADVVIQPSVTSVRNVERQFHNSRIISSSVC